MEPGFDHISGIVAGSRYKDRRDLREVNSIAGNRHYLDYPFVGVGVVVWKDEKFLLIKRGKPPRLGEWSIPGGRQKLGETTRETAIREIKEETNLDIDVTSLIDVVDSIQKDDDGAVRFHATLVDFAADWVAGEAIAGTDAADTGWFGIDDLEDLSLWRETERIIRASRPDR